MSVVQGRAEVAFRGRRDCFLTHNGHRSWSLLLLLSASPVDLFAVITPGLPAASGYSVPAWDKLGALSRIRSSPDNGQGRP
jgi:hypothetical protein